MGEIYLLLFIAAFFLLTFFMMKGIEKLKD